MLYFTVFNSNKKPMGLTRTSSVLIVKQGQETTNHHILNERYPEYIIYTEKLRIDDREIPYQDRLVTVAEISENSEIVPHKKTLRFYADTNGNFTLLSRGTEEFIYEHRLVEIIDPTYCPPCNLNMIFLLDDTAYSYEDQPEARENKYRKVEKLVGAKTLELYRPEIIPENNIKKNNTTTKRNNTTTKRNITKSNINTQTSNINTQMSNINTQMSIATHSTPDSPIVTTTAIRISSPITKGPVIKFVPEKIRIKERRYNYRESLRLLLEHYRATDVNEKRRFIR